MTSPEDDDLEQALRRALSAAADEIEPGPDGLEKYPRADRRPSAAALAAQRCLRRPRSGPALDLARALGVAGSRPRLGALWEPRSRRSNFPRWDIKWLRLVTVLAGAAVIASIGFGVQPFRQAILQASTSLTGNGNGNGNADAARGLRGNRGHRDAVGQRHRRADGQRGHAKRR